MEAKSKSSLVSLLSGLITWTLKSPRIIVFFEIIGTIKEERSMRRDQKRIVGEAY